MRKATIMRVCVLQFSAGLAFAAVWKDDFEDGLGKSWTPAAWMETEPPDWKVEDGVLKGDWPFWNGQMLFLEEYPSQDYTIQVKCRIDKVWQVPELASAGIVFRSAGPGKSPDDKVIPLYGFGIGDSSARFVIFDAPPKFHFVETCPRKHDIGKWYTLKVVVKEGTASCYVDDELACRIYGAQFEGKFVGLSMGSNVTASFDDFMITDEVD